VTLSSLEVEGNMLLDASVVKPEAEFICTFYAGNYRFIDPCIGIGLET